ncbi:hypothetical protein [Photorhabdus temperata]|uniref:hypothetical protein n=1 Tax=Photorhabdus temperata TaxID=574560 RepID=UPI00040D58FE|nr:hypothetical protein [Photorhabdus temperata]
MLDTLAGIGIPQEKIRIVFNRVDSDVDDEFPFILARYKKEKNFTLNKKMHNF